METQQIHSLEGFTMTPWVSSPSDPIQTPEQPHNILNQLDTTIDSSFKLLQQDLAHASSHTRHPPIYGISHMFQTYFPQPFPIHSTLQ
jgi:hypothetical protein